MSDVMSARCWHEDYEKDHENMYTVWCSSCRQPFYGYKRRVICKACHIKDIEKRLTELREANRWIPVSIAIPPNDEVARVRVKNLDNGNEFEADDYFDFHDMEFENFGKHVVEWQQ